MDKTKRKSYERERKLAVVKWCYENGNNISAASRRFQIDRKRIREWVKNEGSIYKTNARTRKHDSGQSSAFPLMESVLHEEFLELRRQGESC